MAASPLRLQVTLLCFKHPQARVSRARQNGTRRPSIQVLGNTATAYKGTAAFPLLQVLADPGDYELRFSRASAAAPTEATAPAVLSLKLRGCITGEANTSAQTAGSSIIAGPQLAPCQKCLPGTISLDPSAAGGCMRCGSSMTANCSGDAMVPYDGFWHSHPRSPLIHRCLLAAACQPSKHVDGMQAWAREHANESLQEMSSSYHDYVEMQCVAGYEVGVECVGCNLCSWQGMAEQRVRLSSTVAIA